MVEATDKDDTILTPVADDAIMEDTVMGKGDTAPNDIESIPDYLNKIVVIDVTENVNIAGLNA